VQLKSVVLSGLPLRRFRGSLDPAVLPLPPCNKTASAAVALLSGTDTLLPAEPVVRLNSKSIWPRQAQGQCHSTCPAAIEGEKFREAMHAVIAGFVLSLTTWISGTWRVQQLYNPTNRGQLSLLLVWCPDELPPNASVEITGWWLSEFVRD